MTKRRLDYEQIRAWAAERPPDRTQTAWYTEIAERVGCHPKTVEEIVRGRAYHPYGQAYEYKRTPTEIIQERLARRRQTVARLREQIELHHLEMTAMKAELRRRGVVTGTEGQ